MNTYNISELIDQAAIKAGGIGVLAKELDLTYQAIRKWQRQNRLPRTEWTGETKYAEKIEALTGIPKAALLTIDRRRQDRRKTSVFRGAV